MTNPHFSIRTSAQSREIARVTRQLRDFFQSHCLSAADNLDLQIAAEEILSNTVRHARIANDPNRLIALRIAVELSPIECVMRFEDDADPVNPLEAPAPDIAVPLKERRRGGLGLHLVRTLMDRVEYERRGEWNRMTVTKRLPVAARVGE